jgi:hypothetical protein
VNLTHFSVNLTRLTELELVFELVLQIYRVCDELVLSFSDAERRDTNEVVAGSEEDQPKENRP